MYKVALILIELLVIYGIFAFQNPFNNAKITAIRGLIAIIVGWAMVILTSLLISKVDMSALTTATEINNLQEKNTARMMGAMFFGWAYPLIFIELVWGSAYLYRYCKDKDFKSFRTLSAIPMMWPFIGVVNSAL